VDVDLPAINIWLSARDAGKKISRSHDYINKRGVPFQTNPVEGRIRYKMLDDEKRYLEQDVENLLQTPPPGRYELTLAG
jgi:cobalamin-dependent methionine synthase I